MKWKSNLFFQKCSHNAIIDCLINGPSSKKYDEEARKFALTLQYYSNRAYAYIRHKFSNNLPHVSTLRKWYQNSSASGDPGLCTQTFQKLKQLANEQKANGNELITSLIFDEMSTKQHLQWSDCQKKFLGHITYGIRPDGAVIPLANNVIVFMLNGVNVEFTLPVAHYFIRSLLAEEKLRLLQDIINQCLRCQSFKCNVRRITKQLYNESTPRR